MSKQIMSAQMHNSYKIYKEKNGKIEKVAQFTNLVLDCFYEYLQKYNKCIIPSGVWFGTGTAEPQASDTGLTTTVWMPTDAIEEVRAPHISEDGSWNTEFVASIPATEAYAGTVTEVGIVFYYFRNGAVNTYLGTKALIKDAEGNPISITKLDTEKLLVEVHMQIKWACPTGYTANPYYNFILDEYIGKTVYIPNLYMTGIRMLATYPDNFTGGAFIGDIQKHTHKYLTASKELVCTNGRFSTENTADQHYINAIGLFAGHTNADGANKLSTVPLGWFEFPNADIFPQRTLSGMSVGTGDGITTEFKPPLNYWVKDTEKIYIDGVQLAREVDYVCDNINNLDNLMELRPSSFCTLHNNVLKKSSNIDSYRAGCHPLKGGYNAQSYYNEERASVYLEWDNAHPLIWELNLDNPIGAAADYFQMNAIYNTLNEAAPAAIKSTVFILSYSNDLQNWTEVGRYTCPNSNNTVATHKFEFEQTITAKYWKLSTDVTNSLENVKNGRFFTTNVSYLGRNGSPIIFTNPPAEGSIITMDADIDRPMKNSNFILDCNPTFQF